MRPAAFITLGALSLLFLGLPFLLVFGAVSGAEENPGAAIGAILLAMLVFIPMIVVYTMFASAYSAALHSEVTGGGSERLEQVFA